MLNIISHIITIVYIELILFCYYNQKNNKDISTSHLYKTDTLGYSFPKIKIPVVNNKNDPDIIPKLEKTHETLYKNYLQILQKNLGTLGQNSMGGLSLIKKDNISVEKYNKEHSYPGDVSILEKINRFFPDIFNDLDIIKNNLKESLHNISNKYWKRDINYWINKITKDIFFPDSINKKNSKFAEHEIEQRFNKLKLELKKLYKKEIDIMKTYIEKVISMRNRMKRSENESKQLDEEIKFMLYSSKSHICFIKRQITIIYKIVSKLSQTNLVSNRINQLYKHKLTYGPLYSEQSFISHINSTKFELEELFRVEVSRLSTYSEHKDLSLLSRSLLDFQCDNTHFTQNKIKLSNVVNNNKDIPAISQYKFWSIFISNIKHIDIKKPKSKYLNGLYIPVYEKKGSYYKYYLFDIMPLVKDGDYLTTFGNKKSPQWLTVKDIDKQKGGKSFWDIGSNNNTNNSFKDNKIYVMVSNRPEEISNTSKWFAISIKWLDNLVDKAESNDNNMTIIRIAMYTILTQIESYDDKFLNKKVIGHEDNNSTNGYSDFVNALLKYRYSGDFIKKNNSNKKNIVMLSREFIQREIYNSIKQFYQSE